MNNFNQSDVRQRFSTSLRRLPKIHGGITLLSIDDSNSLLSSINNQENIQRTDFYNHCNIVHYKSLSKWMKYMKNARSYERIIVLLVINDCNTNDKGMSNIDRIHRMNQYEQIQSLIIIDRTNKINPNDDVNLFTNIKDNLEKLAGIHNDYQSAYDHLQKLISDTEELDDGSLTKCNKRDKSLKDVHQDFIEFVSTHSYRVILQEMPYKSAEAKRQMLNEIDAVYRGKSKPSADIDRFKRTYNSSDAIHWYTRSCFLYQMINRALRTEDIRALYTFRYFIMDLSACLKELAVITRARYKTPFRCYRGSQISREEIEQWYSEKLVATNTFWSTSLDKNVAKPFADISSTAATFVNRNRESKVQHVLFEIDIDFTRSPNLIVADVSHVSAFEDEHEILFDLGTPLYIIDKRYDEEHRVWCIRMSSSSEVDILDHDYSLYIQQRLSHTSGAMLYGNLLVGALGNYKEAVVYFQRLLRILPKDDKNRPNIYYELGRVYFFMGKHEQSVEYFRAAQLLQQRSLPQSKFDYGRTLAGLGIVYSEMGKLDHAIHCSERALAMYQTLFPKDRLEINEIINQLAYDLYKNGQYERAFDLLSNAVTSSKKNLLLTNPQTQLYHTLGLVHKVRGNRIEAVSYLKQALELREKWSHKNHPYIARICYELSLLYDEDNNHIVALEYAQRALQIRQARGSFNKIELKQSIELVERLSQLNARET